MSIQRIRSVAALVAAVLAIAHASSGCARESASGRGRSPESARVDSREFASGTVGRAIDGFWLDMTGVRRWYAVMDSLNRYAARDSTFGLSLNFPLDSPLAPHLASIDASLPLKTALATQRMSGTEFIALTACIGGTKLLRHLADSLGTKPDHGWAEVIAFIDEHRAEIDSLETAIGREPDTRAPDRR